MAKISANGCHELARWQGPIERDPKYPDTAFRATVVLRSDGAVLRKSDVQHRPGERWSGGTYTVWSRLCLAPTAKVWQSLEEEERQRRISLLTCHLTGLGFREVTARPPQGLQLDRMYRKWKTGR